MDMSLSKLRELVADGQGGLACCDSWGRKELDTTERLNWTEERKNTSIYNGKMLSILRNILILEMLIGRKNVSGG